MPDLSVNQFRCLAALIAMVMPTALWAADALPSGSDAAFRASTIAAFTSEKGAVPSMRAPRDRDAPPIVISPFGYRTDPIDGGRRLHAGVDVPAKAGTPVRASDSGIIRFAGRAGGYGNMIAIDHPGGLTTRYAHLSRILVRPGLHVRQGEQIALSGATGRVTGPHLHFEVRAGRQAIDPIPYFGNKRVPDRPSGDHEDAPAGPHLSAFAKATATARFPGPEAVKAQAGAQDSGCCQAVEPPADRTIGLANGRS